MQGESIMAETLAALTDSAESDASLRGCFGALYYHLSFVAKRLLFALACILYVYL